MVCCTMRRRVSAGCAGEECRVMSCLLPGHVVSYAHGTTPWYCERSKRASSGSHESFQRESSLAFDHAFCNVFRSIYPTLSRVVVYSSCAGHSAQLHTRYDQPIDHLSEGADDAMHPGLVSVFPHSC